MLFPPARVCSGGVCDVRAFFAADAVDIDLKGAGIGAEDVADLGDALEKVVVRSIDMSENGALGASGVGRLVSCCAGEAYACVVFLLHLLACW